MCFPLRQDPENPLRASLWHQQEAQRSKSMRWAGKEVTGNACNRARAGRAWERQHQPSTPTYFSLKEMKRNT